MSPTMLFVFILLTCAGAFFLGKRRAFSVSEGAGGALRLHSRPAYYGMLAALWCSIPALLIYGCWLAFEDKIITSLVVADLPEQMRNLPENHLNLMVNDIKNLVNGNIVSGQVDPAMRAAAEHYRNLAATSRAALAVVSLSAGILAMVGVLKKITPRLRARNAVEKVILVLLIVCSTIAIFTTIGIVLSVLFEAIRFIRAVPITEFLFGVNL